MPDGSRWPRCCSVTRRRPSSRPSRSSCSTRASTPSPGARPSASWRCRRRGCASTAMPRAAGMPRAGKGKACRPRPRPVRGHPGPACRRCARAGVGGGRTRRRRRPGVCRSATLAIDKGRASFTDRSLALPVALDLLELSLQAQGWALDGAAAMPFQLRTRVAVPAGPSGRAVGAGVVGSVDARGELKGSVAGVPQSAKATLAAQGPAAAPARSLSRCAGPARRPEGADQLQGHARVGAHVRRQ